MFNDRFSVFGFAGTAMTSPVFTSGRGGTDAFDGLRSAPKVAVAR